MSYYNECKDLIDEFIHKINHFIEFDVLCKLKKRNGVCFVKLTVHCGKRILYEGLSRVTYEKDLKLLGKWLNAAYLMLYFQKEDSDSTDCYSDSEEESVHLSSDEN